MVYKISILIFIITLSFFWTGTLTELSGPEIADPYYKTKSLLTTAEPVISIHEEPAGYSKLVTQALLGQPIKLIRATNNWAYVEVADGSQGYVQASQLTLFSYTIATDSKIAVVMEPVADLFSFAGEERLSTVFLGTYFPAVDWTDTWVYVLTPHSGLAKLKRNTVLLATSLATIPPGTPQELLTTAGKFLETPYLWGGLTKLGIDCSGFTYLTFLLNGYQLPRDAQDQFATGRPVSGTELKPGDLVFFSTYRKGPSHVGIYLGEHKFIHASSKTSGVAITSLNYSHYKERYLGAKRIINN